jgi:spore coat protein A
MDIKKWTPTRRQLLKAGLISGAGMMLPWRYMLAKAEAVALRVGLSDPAMQPKFMTAAPNALDPLFMYSPAGGKYTVGVGLNSNHQTGLRAGGTGALQNTPIFGYGNGGYTWPGKTFEIQNLSSGGDPTTTVEWQNNLSTSHLLPVDTSLHWCFSLPGYTGYSIAANGVPIITHLHGGHTDYQFDGNPEFFYTPGGVISGPQWATAGYPAAVPDFVYDNDVPAGTLWYHDHALGITRLNVYAGMAGFYIVRDALDTGAADNPLGLPAYPYELAYAIQDRMFQNNGALFYPANPGDPFYADFITAMGVTLPPDQFPGGGPTALAEFFGDHMLVNGKIWPFAQTDNVNGVEPRNYRMRLLNGCDSRFLAIRFRVARRPTSTTLRGASRPVPFWVIGSDQGLAGAATQTDTLIVEPGGRWDIVFDFAQVPAGSRVIMENIAPDAPFGGQIGGGPAANFFPDRQTDRIMAFDVTLPLDNAVPDAFAPANIGQYAGNNNPVVRTRKVALFEGLDEFGRLQPLLGTAEPATDYMGNAINWPDDSPAGPYFSNGLVGQMEGSIAWHSPTTENPENNPLGAEVWEIYNATADAHPIHLHLVNFQILDRQRFTADLVPQPVVQHNGTTGSGFRLANIRLRGRVTPAEAVENAPKDMVTSYPGEVTRIKVTFDKSGRYVWHCHILSHEDHEMMRVLQVT